MKPGFDPFNIFVGQNWVVSVIGLVFEEFMAFDQWFSHMVMQAIPELISVK